MLSSGHNTIKLKRLLVTKNKNVSKDLKKIFIAGSPLTVMSSVLRSSQSLRQQCLGIIFCTLLAFKNNA